MEDKISEGVSAGMAEQICACFLCSVGILFSEGGKFITQ
jgi:hypothetical protein